MNSARRSGVPPKDSFNAEPSANDPVSESDSSSTVYSAPSTPPDDAKGETNEKKGMPRVKSVTFPTEGEAGGKSLMPSRSASQGDLPPLAPKSSGASGRHFSFEDVSLDGSTSTSLSGSDAEEDDDGDEDDENDTSTNEGNTTSDSANGNENKDDDDDSYSIRKAHSSSRMLRSPTSSMMVHDAGFGGAHRSEMMNFTDDNRSTLVSHLDVEVAVRKRSLAILSNKMYLRVRVAHLKQQLSEALRRRVLAHHVSSILSDEEEEKLSKQTTATMHDIDAQILESQNRLFSLYRRQMDAIVERYLSAPQYVAARWYNRQHLPLAEQRLYSSNALARFEISSTSSYSRARTVENARHNTRNLMMASSAHRRDSNLGNSNEQTARNAPRSAHHPSRSSKVVAPDAGTADALLGSASEPEPTKGKYKYELTSHDMELFVQDAARRSRFRDDTLPWRPVDFRMTALRLEPLDLGVKQAMDSGDQEGNLEMGYSSSFFNYTSGDRPGGPGPTTEHVLRQISTNAVGGSVNLLIEILLMTEVDPPFTSGVPEPTFTNVFMFLSEMFVTPDCLIAKFIRFFRSVRRWRTDAADAERATYLLCRTVECMQAYCRCHECDLTFQVIQRLSAFLESVGFAGVDNNSHYWPCKQGVYDPTNLNDFDLARGYKKQSNGDFRGTGAHGRSSSHRANGFLFRKSMGSPTVGESGTPALDMRVQQLLVSLSVYLQIIYRKYYVKVCDVFCDRREFRRSPKASQRGGHGLSSDHVSTTLPQQQQSAQETVGVYINKPTPRGRLFSLILAKNKEQAANSRDDEGEGAPNTGTSATAAPSAGPSLIPAAAAGGGGGGARPDRFVSFGFPLSYWPHRAKMDVIFPSTIDAEQLSHQLCLLSYHLFTAVHIREMLYNTWSLASMRMSVAQHLQKLLHYSAQLRLWATAVVVVPQKLTDCQRALRHLLDVCRMLYELQNYEIAASVLEGLRHPAVEAVRSEYNNEFMQPMLSATESRELETLTQMMNPYASYSPSSLNSITARTSSAIETSLIPILAPILQILLSAQQGSSQWTSHDHTQVSNEQRVAFVRNTDGQFVVNWTKVMSIGHVVKIWLRCQSVPYKFTPDVVLQEYLWSIRDHCWSDDLLSRIAKRPRQ